MLRRFCVSILASIIVLTTVYESTVSISAAEISENISGEVENVNSVQFESSSDFNGREEFAVAQNQENETEEVPEKLDVIESVTDNVWDRLFSYAINYEKNVGNAEKNHEGSKELAVFIDANLLSNEVILSAKEEYKEIRLTLGENNETCEIIFSVEKDGEKHEFKAEQKISDITGDIAFVYDLKSDDNVVENYSEEANSLLKDCVFLWNDFLSSIDLTWSDLGFEYWEELCDIAGKASVEADALKTGINAEEVEEFDIEDVNIKDRDIGDDNENDVGIVVAESALEDISEGENADGSYEINDESDMGDSELEKFDVETSDETVFGDEETEEVSEEMLDMAVQAPEVDRIEAAYSKIELKIGESLPLKAKFYPENADAVITWEIRASLPEESACVVIDSSNILTANSTNSSDIWVVAKAGTKEKMIEVSVKENTIAHDKDEFGNPTIVMNDDDKQIVIAEGIWVGGFEQFGKIYTGSKVKQQLDVYYKGTKLKLDKDYTLSYKNNTKACDAFQTNSPSVTITMKGQYTGKKTLFYEILKASASDFDIKTDKTALNYNGKEQKHIPTVYFNGKKLENKKDYTIEYDPEHVLSDLKGSSTESTAITYRLEGKGNFEGEKYGTYYITPKQYNLSKAAVSLVSTIKYNGQEIKIEDLNLKIRLPGEKEYSQLDENIFNVNLVISDAVAGTGKVIITAVEGTNCSGTISKTFKIVAANKLSEVADINENFDLVRTFYKNTNWNEQVGTCEGDRKQLLSLKADGTKLTRGIDYEVKYSGISKTGTATATFKGIGKYTGTLVRTYKLVNNSTEPVITVEESVPYVQGGSKATIGVMLEETDPWGDSALTYLSPNTDYTVSYSNNTKVGQAIAKIIFKGNYKKVAAQSRNYEITAGDISQCKVKVADKNYSSKNNFYKSVPAVYSSNGKKLVEGKDYSKNFEYIYNDMDITNAPPAGTLVMVKITGINNYAGSFVTGTYKVYDGKNCSMDKLYISIDDQIYTGKAIEPDFENDIHIYTSSTDRKKKQNEILNPGLRIVSYKNNIKTGTASVVFGGAYDGTTHYGGTKTVTFKIKKRSNNNVAVSGIYFENTKETLFSTSTKATKVLVARFKPEAPTNTTLIWKSSNPNIVSIYSIDGQECTIEAQAKGSAVISCTTQDGAKVAKCTITSTMKQFTGISLNQSTILLANGEATGEPLRTGFVPEDAYVADVDLSSMTFSSSDEDIAVVDSDGYITAKGKGIATVTANLNGYKATCVVAVDTSLVNVKDYGAKGDGVTDDTNKINSAIESIKLTGGNVYFPAGTYVVSTPSGGEAAINLNDAKNVNVYMDTNAVIYHGKDSSSSMRGVICLDRAENVSINGGFINCDRAKQSVDEDYYGIMIVRSKEITINGTKIANSKGDGIYLGKDHLSGINKNITISHCTIEGCRRNNISLVNVDSITIEECNINGARGYYLPGVDYAVGGTGIDVEPNRGQNQYATNININKCVFKGNRSDFGIHCHYKNVCSYSKDITLDGCSFDKLVYIQCGTNVVFKNTVKRPKEYCDDRNGYTTKFPD